MPLATYPAPHNNQKLFRHYQMVPGGQNRPQFRTTELNKLRFKFQLLPAVSLQIYLTSLSLNFLIYKTERIISSWFIAGIRKGLCLKTPSPVPGPLAHKHQLLASFAFLPVRSVKANLTQDGLTARAAAACLTIQAMTSRKLNIEVREGECLIWPQITQSSRVLGLGFRGNFGL